MPLPCEVGEAEVGQDNVEDPHPTFLLLDGSYHYQVEDNTGIQEGHLIPVIFD